MAWNSPGLYPASTVLGVYLKRTCSRVTSASSAVGVVNDYVLYKSTHSLTLVWDGKQIGNESVTKIILNDTIN